MSATTYLDLPINTLYDLLILSVKEMIEASESKKEDGVIEFRIKKKQVELLMDTIAERRAMEAH